MIELGLYGHETLVDSGQRLKGLLAAEFESSDPLFDLNGLRDVGFQRALIVAKC